MFTKSILIIYVILVSLGLNFSCLWAAVSGQVKDENGKGVKGVVVEFTEESNPKNFFSDVTDDMGNYTLSSINTSVDASRNEYNKPHDFELYQAYPNPFNPTVTIPYQLDKNSYTSLKIYNVLGQLVKTLASEYQGAGFYKVHWDGRDDRGVGQPAGIYFYQLRINSQKQTKKMVKSDGFSKIANGARHSTISLAKQNVLENTAQFTVSITGQNIIPFLQKHITIKGDTLIDFQIYRKAALPGFITLKQDQLGNIFTTAEEIKFPLSSDGDSVAWTIRDFRHRLVASGVDPVIAGEVVIQPQMNRVGYFELSFVSQKDDMPTSVKRTTFCIIRTSQTPDISSSPFGVMTHFAQGWYADIIPLIAKAGIRHIRDEQYWKYVEPEEKGEYCFNCPDNRFSTYRDAAEANGIEVLTVMSFENKLYDDGLTPYTEDGRQGYANYGTALLDRYDKQIKTFEIWNEYNGTWCTGPAANDRPAYYYEMLKTSYETIKAVRPDVTVLGGACVLIPYGYLESMFQHGALDYMDAVVIHPYRESPEGVDDDVKKLQDIIKQYNDGNSKPIWVTECGTMDKSEEGRHNVARYLTHIYSLLLSEGVERIYWYLLRDYDVFTTMGLLYQDTEPMGRYVPAPAYAAYSNLIHQLSGSSFIRKEELGTYSKANVCVFEKDEEEIRVCWAVQDRNIIFTVNNSLTVVDIMGNESLHEPSNGQIIMKLDSNTVYVKGKVQDVKVIQTNLPIANSEEDYNDTQGTNNWYYGYYDGDGKGIGDGNDPGGAYSDDDFEEMTYKQTQWGYEWQGPYSYLKLSESGAHPSNTGGRAVWAVRRWTSSVSNNVRLAGKIDRFDKNGDGVEAKILVGGTEVYSKLLSAGESINFDLQIYVNNGSNVDFAITPGKGTDISYDATNFIITIFLD